MAKSRHAYPPNGTTRARLHGFMHPVGMSRPAVYWGRRFGALVVLGVLASAVAWSTGGGGAAPRAATTSPESRGQAAATMESCQSPAVSLRVLGPSWTGPRSGWPQMTIELTNQTRSPCLIDTRTVGVLGVGHGGVVSWMSASCSSAKPALTSLVELPARKSRTWTIAWHPSSMKPDCGGRALSPSGPSFYVLALGHLTQRVVLVPKPPARRPGVMPGDSRHRLTASW